MDPGEKRFTTSTLVAAADCEIGTFHKWRSRNHLFPETLDSAGWNKFSFVDICVVRIIAVLTAVHRLSADRSVYVAQQCAADISRLFSSEPGLSDRLLCLYPREGDSDPVVFTVRNDMSVAEAMRIGGSVAYSAIDWHEPLPGLLTIIDLHWILIHVAQRLNMLELEGLPRDFMTQIPALQPSLPKPAPQALITGKRNATARRKGKRG
jgi:hypothetical protein